MQRVLKRETAMEIKRLYDLKDDRGRRRYTMMEIAKMMHCGETTVYRAIKSLGGYANVPEPISETEMELRIAASKRKIAAEFGLVLPEDMQDKPADTGVMARMSQMIAQEREKQERRNPDNLIEELKNGIGEIGDASDATIPRDPLDE